MQGSERHGQAETKPGPFLAVKGKTGEVEAVLKTKLSQPVDIMIELLGSTGPVTPKIIQAGIEAAGAGRPLWIDATRLPVSSSLGEIPPRGASTP